MELERTLYRVQDRILSHPKMAALTHYCAYFLFAVALLCSIELFFLNQKNLNPIEFSEEKDQIYHLHINNGNDSYIFMKYAHNQELLKLDSELLEIHNFTTINITHQFDEYVDTVWDYFLYFGTNLETLFLNNVARNIQQDIYVLNNATNQTFVWKHQEEKSTNILIRIFNIITNLAVLCLGIFIASSVAALYIKMTIICAPVIIIMMMECMSLFGNREIQPAILARAFPWIGVYLNILEQSQKSKKQLIFAFAFMLLLFYFIYLSSVLLATYMLFKNQVPYGLEENFFGLIAINEFAAMLFLHTRSSLYFVPKFILIYYMFFLFYIQQTNYGFYQLALYAILYACLGTYCVFISIYEIPSLTWNPQSFYTPTVDRPRCFYLPVFSMTWMSDLPQLWSMFYPLYGRRYLAQYNPQLDISRFKTQPSWTTITLFSTICCNRTSKCRNSEFVYTILTINSNSSMAQFQNLVSELLATLEDLREKREETKVEIYEEEEERHRIEKELEILSERLDRVNETIMRTATDKKELEKTIGDTEHTKNKIVESLKTLLQVLQKESQYHIKD